jgi:hypothetical protein
MPTLILISEEASPPLLATDRLWQTARRTNIALTSGITDDFINLAERIIHHF